MTTKKKSVVNLGGAFVLATGMLGGTTVASEAQDLKQCRLIQSGEASWYGPGFNGNVTRHGEIFNENAMTAAHNSLPGGTEVWVENVENGRAVEVRINDTGGFGKYGRIIDGSKAVATALGYRNAGTADVNLYLC